MEALIYNESPLAEYLEGDATPFESEPPAPSTPPQYAPRGLPRVRDRLRALRDTATSVASLGDERFLERFRYVLVASQLLSDDSKLRTRPPDEDSTLNIPLSVRGTLFAIGLSFFIPWLLAWACWQIRSPVPFTWTQLAFYFLVALCATAFFILSIRRQYSRFVRQSAISAASRLVSESHSFDAAISAALRHIQEIEVVARGYQLSVFSPSSSRLLTIHRSHPLPPISRLEERVAVRHCRALRGVVAESLTASLARFIYFHNELQPFANVGDLESYYHIYEISSEDFAGAVNFANDLSSEAQETLKQLRFLVSLHGVARKLLLIDLLALRPTSSFIGIHLWRRTLRILHTLTEDTVQASQRLQSDMESDDQREIPNKMMSLDGDMVESPAVEEDSPSKQQSKMQIKRFEAIAGAVRSLNAKVRVARDDVAQLIANDASDETINCMIGKHYEHVGSVLRSLLVDWERGRNSLLLRVDTEGRFSRPSSGVRSPISPSPSLGGLTMVDGGPSDALRLLNGDDELCQHLHDGEMDEEIFEAVAKPRKQMSLALSREEKIARLQEDRRKRATLQEQADTTTSMLRELQMVIKHRPPNRSSTRITSV